MRHSLQVYVADWCPGCDEARALARIMSSIFPGLHVQVIDIAKPGAQLPKTVFAMPTYLLDGELLWLGNPRREEAIQHIHTLLGTGQNA